MAEVRVRNVDDWVVEWFRTQARAQGHSLEGEIRTALTDAARLRKQQIASELRAGLERYRAKYGEFSDSAAWIREERDARG
jgi:plasmid stability protein